MENRKVINTFKQAKTRKEDWKSLASDISYILTREANKEKFAKSK